MTSMGLAACALLAWVGPPATSAPAPAAPTGPTYEVMSIKSGVELVVKKDGKPLPVSLFGIEPARGADKTKAPVERLNQTNELRDLVKVGSQVRLKLKTGAAAAAHVYRASDDLWLNKAMVDRGFAVAVKAPSDSTHDELAAAEARARKESQGMWAPDFYTKADQLTPATRAPKTVYQRQPDPMPVPTQGAFAINPGVGNVGAVPFNAGAVQPGRVYVPGVPGFTPSGAPMFVTPDTFARDANGRERTDKEKQALYRDYLDQQRQETERQKAFSNALIQQAQQNGGYNPAGATQGGAIKGGNGMPNMNGGFPNQNGGFPNMNGGFPNQNGGGMPFQGGGNNGGGSRSNSGSNTSVTRSPSTTTTREIRVEAPTRTAPSTRPK